MGIDTDTEIKVGNGGGGIERSSNYCIVGIAPSRSSSLNAKLGCNVGLPSIQILPLAIYEWLKV